MQNKKLYIDVATPGLDPLKHAVIQIAGIIVIDGEEKETFNLCVSPLPHREIDDKALEINGRTRQELKIFDSPAIAFKKLIKVLEQYVSKFDTKDKFHFIAYNSPFDNQFMREFFIDAGDRFFGSWFWVPDICIMRKAADKLCHERHWLANFKLATVAEYLEIDTSQMQLHDALADIQVTMAIEDKLRNLV
jgi:DNA polymerase-3 subunit epsilon